MSRATSTWNGFETELSAELGVGIMTVSVLSTAGLSDGVYLAIDADTDDNREWVQVQTVVSATELALSARGLPGSVSPAKPHPVGAKVSTVYTKQVQDDIFADISDNKDLIDDVALDLSDHLADAGDPHLAAGYLLVDGTKAMQARLDMGTFPIINVVDPTDAQDAATKKFVEDQIGTIPVDDFLKLNGSTPMEGDLDLGGNDIVNVGDIEGYLPLDGAKPMTGTLTIHKSSAAAIWLERPDTADAAWWMGLNTAKQFAIRFQDNGGASHKLLLTEDAVPLTVSISGISTDGSVRVGNGTAAAPSHSFVAHPDVGMYAIDAETIGFAVGLNRHRLSISPTHLLLGHATSDGSPSLGMVKGSAGSPAYSFRGDENSGMFQVSEGVVGISADASTVARFTAGGVVNGANAGAGFFLNGIAGTAAAPTYAFGNYRDMGMYRHGANQVGIAMAGAAKLVVGNTSSTFFTTLRLPNGSDASPAYSFADHTGTGMFAITNGIRLTVNGTSYLLVSTTQFIAPTVYTDAGTGAANVVVESNGRLRRTTTMMATEDYVDSLVVKLADKVSVLEAKVAALESI